VTADDIVWRRSKLGLRLSPAEIAAIDDWIARRIVFLVKVPCWKQEGGDMTVSLKTSRAPSMAFPTIAGDVSSDA